MQISFPVAAVDTSDFGMPLIAFWLVNSLHTLMVKFTSIVNLLIMLNSK